MRKSPCPQSLVLFAVVLSAVVWSAVVPAQAAEWPCAVQGEQVTLDRVRVGERLFRVEGLPVTATDGERVQIQGALSFSGTAAPTHRLRQWGWLLQDRLWASAQAPLHLRNGFQEVTFTHPGRATVQGPFSVACGRLTLDPAPDRRGGARVPRGFPRALQERLVPRERWVELFAAPDGTEAIRVQLSAGAYFRRSETRGAWTRVTARFQNGAIAGWARSDTLRHYEANDGAVEFVQPALFPAPDCEAADTPEASYVGPATVAVGADVWTGPGGTRWATLTIERPIQVRYQEGSDWVAIDQLEGLREWVPWRQSETCRQHLVSAWISREQVTFPEPRLATRQTAPTRGQIRQISVGDRHYCGLTAAGSVMCWGENEAGQLGDGSTRGRKEPRAVLGLNDVVEVSAGGEHTCARHRDGAVSCWGLLAGRRYLSPVAAKGLRLQAMAAHREGTCGVRVSGEVGCFSERWVSLEGLRRVRSLVAQGPRTCALHQSGRVTCWRGQGDQMWSDLTEVERLWVQGETTCVLRAGGEVYCDRETPQQRMSGVHALALSAGGGCVVDGTGLSCWGAFRGPGDWGADVSLFGGGAGLCAQLGSGALYCAQPDDVWKSVD